MKTSNLLWGFLLVIIGFIFALNALEITNINVFFNGWWTLFIIVPCLIGLFNEKDKTGNLIGLGIGLALFLACQDFIGFDLILKLTIPFIIIIVGLSLIFKNMDISTNSKKKNKNLKEHCATFGEQKLNYENEQFKGCDLTAVFGGIDLDLRKSEIVQDVYINATSIFGGVDIFVPDDVDVKISSTSIFGGTSNKKQKNIKDFKYTIYVNTICIFGGVDIK